MVDQVGIVAAFSVKGVNPCTAVQNIGCIVAVEFVGRRVAGQVKQGTAGLTGIQMFDVSEHSRQAQCSGDGVAGRTAQVKTVIVTASCRFDNLVFECGLRGRSGSLCLEVDNVGIITKTANQRVGATATFELVVGRVAGDEIGQCIAGTGKVADTSCQRQVFKIVTQRVVDARYHRVDLGRQRRRLDDRIAGIINVVGIVARAANQEVRSQATIQRVVAGTPIKRVVARIAGQDVG